jgi:hypothetical protein
MLMKKYLILLLWLLCQHASQAQEKSDAPKVGIKSAYMSSVISPGFKVGIEYLTKVVTKKKQRSWGTKTILKERYWTLNLGFYRQVDFHSNLYLLAERQFRRQYGKGFFMEMSPGIGYSRTFLDHATYTLADDGTVSKKTLAGYNYLMLSMAGGLGYDFSKTKNLPLKLYLKPCLFTIFPYNSNKLIRPSYEIGVIFTPNSKK